MPLRQSSFTSPSDGVEIATYAWERPAEPRGVVEIAHGLAEHALRYDRLAQALTKAGYAAYAMDHRGHGRSVTDPADLGNFGEAGFVGVPADIAAFGERLRAENPGLPVFLVGHSMGSMAAQEVLLDHSDLYDGVVLSGTTAVDVLAATMAEAAASAEPGGDAPAGLEAFNVGFEHRTGYEWLSRDEAEVDKYVADPLSGFALPDETVPAIFERGGRLADAKELAAIRKDLPLLLVSGERDPLAGGGQLIELQGQRYRDAGITDVTVQIYPDARHEIFNETNRDEVTADLIGWIDAHNAS